MGDEFGPAGQLPRIKLPRFCFTVAGIESIAMELPRFCLNRLDFVAGMESIAMEAARSCLDRLDFLGWSGCF